MSTRVRVVPVVVGDASVYVVERRYAGGGDGVGGGAGGDNDGGDCNSGRYLVANDVRRLAALKETKYYSVQKLALATLDEAARRNALVTSRADDVAALMAAGALATIASHFKLVSLDLAKAMLAFSVAPLVSCDRLQRAVDRALRHKKRARDSDDDGGDSNGDGVGEGDGVAAIASATCGNDTADAVADDDADADADDGDDDDDDYDWAETTMMTPSTTTTTASTSISATTTTPSPSPSSTVSSRSLGLPPAAVSPALRQQLLELRRFWCDTVVLRRLSDPLAAETYTKMEGHVLGFLGYVWRNRVANAVASANVLLALFRDASLLQRFVQYAKTERAITDASLANYVTTIVRVLKFLHRNDARVVASSNFAVIPDIAAWQSQRNSLQKAGERASTSKTAGQLRAQGKWLDWSELLDMCKRLKTQLGEFADGGGGCGGGGGGGEGSRVGEGGDGDGGVSSCDPRARAIVEQEYLCVLLYVALPPARCKEYYLLAFEDPTAANRIEVRNGGDGDNTAANMVLVISDAKNARGRTDETSLADVGFVQDAIRAWMRSGGGHDTLASDGAECRRLFVNPRSGRPFEKSYAWTRYVEAITQRYTGQSVSPSKLRSAAVTFFWSDREEGGGGGGGGDGGGGEGGGGGGSSAVGLRESLAAAMRHGVAVARRVYDRSTSSDKKRRAVKVVGEQARKALWPST
jgi:hypothetical protein